MKIYCMIIEKVMDNDCWNSKTTSLIYTRIGLLDDSDHTTATKKPQNNSLTVALHVRWPSCSESHEAPSKIQSFLFSISKYHKWIVISFIYAATASVNEYT